MKQKAPKPTRRKYSPEFKDQVLIRSERDGVAQTALDLGIQELQIYACFWKIEIGVRAPKSLLA